MKRFSLGMIALLIISTGLMTGFHPGGDRVGGVILNLYGNPLRGATVTLAGEKVVTTEAGTFAFESGTIQEGTHNLTVHLHGKQLHSQEVSVSKGAALQIFVNDDDNLLPNPGFETGFNENGYPIGWRGSPYYAFGNEFQLDETVKRSGNAAMKIIYPSNRTGGLHLRTDEHSILLPVQPGEVFEARAYVYNDQGKKVVMMLVFLDADHTEIVGSSRAMATEKDVWTELAVTSRPAPDKAAQLRLMFWQTTDTQGSVTYIDDVRLVKVAQ